MHIIINAWILAVGLIPSKGPLELKPDFYDELWVLIRGAVAGLLDWQTLVAWLFCNGDTTSQTLSSVPEGRRFQTTQYENAIHEIDKKGRRQFTGEGQLTGRLQRLSEQDQEIIANKTETELPYDHGNNIKFLEEDSTTPVSGGDVTGKGKEQRQTGNVRTERRSGGEDDENKRESNEEEQDNARTKASLDDLGFAPNSAEHLVLQQCTEEEIRTFKTTPENKRTELLETFQMKLLSRQNADNDESLARGLFRVAEDCYEHRQKKCKQMALASLKRSGDEETGDSAQEDQAQLDK